MKKEKFKELPDEHLENKIKGLKAIGGILMGLTIALSFFTLRNYLNGQELDWASITIILCTLGGFFSVYQDLQEAKKEIRTRS